MPTLSEALTQFDAVEANLGKLEALWKEIVSMIPTGVVYGDSTEGVFDDRCRAFTDIAGALPAVDGWKLTVAILSLNEIAQNRFDADGGDFDCMVRAEESIFSQEKHLQEYRYRFNKKRRSLVRTKLIETIDEADRLLQELTRSYPDDYDPLNDDVEGDDWIKFVECVATIDMLLGSAISRPPRWGDLKRHIHFHLVKDLIDIRSGDWPEVKAGISATLYGDAEPIPQT